MVVAFYNKGEIMSENLMEEFKKIEKQVETNKTEKVRLEERLKGLQEERNKLISELTKLGVKEEDLENTIAQLEKEITEELARCQNLLK